MFGEIEEVLQSNDPQGLGARQVDLLGVHRAIHLHATTGTAHSNVQSTFTAADVQWTEVHRYVAILVWSVSDGEKNNISLVTLHIL